MESTTAGGATFRREGEYWSIAHGEESLRLRDSKGLHYVANLLARPGQEVHVLDLVAAVEGRPAGAGDARRQAADAGLRESGLGDAGAALDPEARAAYKARLDELRDELEEAEAWNDPERVAKAREEMEFLAGELAGAAGLAGRERRAADPAERARQSVSKAVKVALERISEHGPYLGRHLERNIHTGIFCRYDPDPNATISWATGSAVGRPEVTRPPAGQEVPEPAREPAARRFLLVGVAVAVAAVVAGGSALLVAASGDADGDTSEETSAFFTVEEAADSTVQIFPLIATPDGAFRREVGWATGTMIDSRGLVLTSYDAVAPERYGWDRLDAYGIGFPRDDLRTSAPRHLAQLIASDEHRNLALLIVTSDAGAPVDADNLPTNAARLDAEHEFAVDGRLQLAGFPGSGKLDDFDTSVDLLVALATSVVSVGGLAGPADEPERISTSLSATAGEEGGPVFDDQGNLVGVITVDSATGSASVVPISLAASLLNRATSLLEGNAGPAPTMAPLGFSAERGEPARSQLSTGLAEFYARFSYSGATEGALWGVSCLGPDGVDIGGGFPPVRVWTAGSSGEVDVKCETRDGFELAAGTYTASVSFFGEDGPQVTAVASVLIAPAHDPAASRLFTARGNGPDFKIRIPPGFAPNDEPYLGEGYLSLLSSTGDSEIYIAPFTGEYSATPLGDLAAQIVAAEWFIQRSDIQPGMRFGSVPTVEFEVEAATSIERDETSGPLAGSFWRLGERVRIILVQINGVNLGISQIVLPDAQTPMAELDAIVATLRFE